MSELLDFFNHSKTVLCICPKCNSIARLAQYTLYSTEKVPKTWLDDYEVKSQQIDEREQKFDEEEEQIREKSREKGRAQVPKLIKKSMGKEFAKLNYNPYDIKALLHPADLVVFDGMTENEMKNVVFLSKSPSSKYLEVLQKGAAKAVSEKSYDWKVVRVSKDGEVEIE
jgi:predicted Holliday junction resolvase-like endonuclease